MLDFLHESLPVLIVAAIIAQAAREAQAAVITTSVGNPLLLSDIDTAPAINTIKL